jgi:hypothetical protein
VSNTIETSYLPNKNAKNEKVKTRNEVNLTSENYLANPTPPPSNHVTKSAVQ